MFEDKEIQTLIISGSVVGLFLIGFVLVVIIRYLLRQQRHLRETERMNAAFQQTILQAQIEIQEQTLKTISQEIHDNIGQVLSLAKLNLHTLVTNQTEKLYDTKQLVSKALSDLRDLSRSMHGDKISELGLQESIINELKILQNTGQFKTHFHTTGTCFKLEPQKELILFRITQESLHNAMKHSNAENIAVQLQYDLSKFILQITDDGIGFDPATLLPYQTGIGLKSIQNRTELIGGTFSLTSSLRKGTTISISLTIIQPAKI